MAKMDFKVSIIIPAYNEEKNIAKLLQSIQKQTYKNIEIIVIDDQSKDDTAKIAKKYTRYVYTRKHAERSIQRNFGASKAKGNYLLFLDADMELSAKVIEDAVYTIKNSEFKALTIPEKTTGRGFISSVRKFERGMYMGNSNYEVARFFDAKVFKKFGGYDPGLTGPEDYDLPFRISKVYKIGRTKEYIYHHEQNLSLARLLKKKYYYAKSGYYYSQKHPELVFTQGTILFRSVYLKNWKKFLKHPLVGASFIIVRALETIWAVAGFISEAGVSGFVTTVGRAIKSEK